LLRPLRRGTKNTPVPAPNVQNHPPRPPPPPPNFSQTAYPLARRTTPHRHRRNRGQLVTLTAAPPEPSGGTALLPARSSAELSTLTMRPAVSARILGLPGNSVPCIARRELTDYEPCFAWLPRPAPRLGWRGGTAAAGSVHNRRLPGAVGRPDAAHPAGGVGILHHAGQ